MNGRRRLAALLWFMFLGGVAVGLVAGTLLGHPWPVATFIAGLVAGVSFLVIDLWYDVSGFKTYLEEADDLQRTLDLVHDADLRAIAAWRSESPAEREIVMPDRARMVIWLLNHFRGLTLTVQRWRHRKHGNVCQVIGWAALEVADRELIGDGTWVTIYRHDDTNELHVRASKEFYDGRFEKL